MAKTQRQPQVNFNLEFMDFKLYSIFFLILLSSLSSAGANNSDVLAAINVTTSDSYHIVTQEYIITNNSNASSVSIVTGLDDNGPKVLMSETMFKFLAISTGLFILIIALSVLYLIFKRLPKYQKNNRDRVRRVKS